MRTSALEFHWNLTPVTRAHRRGKRTRTSVRERASPGTVSKACKNVEERIRAVVREREREEEEEEDGANGKTARGRIKRR